MAGFGMAFPDIQLRAERFAREAGIGKPGPIIGLLLASYFVTQLLASPRWGKLSDHAGRKPVLLICTALSALSMVAYAMATGLWGVLASRILAGFAAANVVVAQAYIADTSTDEDRTAKQGRVSAALMAGLVAGPAIGGELAHFGGNRMLGFVAAGASTLSLLWVALAVKWTKPTAERQPGKQPLVDLRLLRAVPALRSIFVVAAVGWFVLACLEGTFGRLIEHNLGMGQQEFGWIFSYESLLGAFTGILLAWLSRRASSQTILRLGFLFEGVGVGLMPFAPGLFVLFVASTFFAFGTGVANPTINSVCSGLVGEQRQGELFGLLQASRSVGFLLGPLIGGALFDLYPGAPYLLAGSVAVALALLIRVRGPVSA